MKPKGHNAKSAPLQKIVLKDIPSSFQWKDCGLTLAHEDSEYQYN